MEILGTVMRVGTANVTVKKVSGVEVAAGDGRRKLISLVPAVVPPEVAMVVDLEIRDMRVKGQDLNGLVSHLETPSSRMIQP